MKIPLSSISFYLDIETATHRGEIKVKLLVESLIEFGTLPIQKLEEGVEGSLIQNQHQNTIQRRTVVND